MDTGHSGASGRFESIKEVAKEYAFMFKVLDEHQVKISCTASKHRIELVFYI